MSKNSLSNYAEYDQHRIDSFLDNALDSFDFPPGTRGLKTDQEVEAEKARVIDLGYLEDVRRLEEAQEMIGLKRIALNKLKVEKDPNVIAELEAEVKYFEESLKENFEFGRKRFKDDMENLISVGIARVGDLIQSTRHLKTELLPELEESDVKRLPGVVSKNGDLKTG